jgi:predicted alpha/beta-fold hydrolase
MVTTPADYSVPLGFANPHLQSVLASNLLRRQLMFRRARALRRASAQVDMALDDGVRLRGYHSPAEGAARGLITFIHGWEGSVESQYILSAAHSLHRQGYDIFRLNLRDHGSTWDLNEELFHSCRIDEVVAAIKWIQTNYAVPRHFLVGFSLGGNFGLRIALRAPAAGIKLDRVIAVCPVLSPANTMLALERGPWIYRHHFLTKWRRSLTAKAAAFPHLYQFGDLRRLPTLTATTRYFVEHHTPFDSLEAYLHGYAIVDEVLAGLEVPSKMILARDDPVIPIDDLGRVAQSRSLDISVATHGGHCGFLSGLGLGSWIDRQIAQQVHAFS